MALSLKKLRERTRQLYSKRLGPKNDIQKDIIESDSDGQNSYHLSALIGDIKKNWSDIKTLNKKI
ncbi:MAG: hypothetical protein KW793_03275 [Candidatus Doudnabacteria bacterium]|nr:hypothetical protein [Candidatus Doudnabacteria bacterium]